MADKHLQRGALRDGRAACTGDMLHTEGDSGHLWGGGRSRFGILHEESILLRSLKAEVRRSHDIAKLRISGPGLGPEAYPTPSH